MQLRRSSDVQRGLRPRFGPVYSSRPVRAVRAPDSKPVLSTLSCATPLRPESLEGNINQQASGYQRFRFCAW